MNTNPSYLSTDYVAHQHQVDLVNDVFDGVDTATKYLTKFPRESEDVFNDRRSKATLKNFVKRIGTSTRNILIGKPPVVEVNPTIEPLLAKIDKKRSLEAFIREVALYQTLDGYTFIIIDAPKIDESVRTLADQIAQGIEPYMYIARRSSVVNYIIDSNGDFERLTIKETYEKERNRYDVSYGDQYRTYFNDGTVEIWRDNVLFSTTPLGVNFVPAVRIGSSDIPHLYDITKLNINHMNRRSNLDRYLSAAALPVPVLYGSIASDNSSVTIGVDDALIFSDKNESGFEWVELSGASIKALHEDLLSLEESILQEAIILTSNDLTVAKNEAQVNAETIEGFGRLTHMANDLESGLNKAIDYLGKFKGLTDSGTITLDKEFKSTKLTSEEVKDIISLHTSGMISLETALVKLIEGKVIEVESLDQEKAKINELN